MPLYKILISETAAKQINKLPHPVRNILLTSIESLATNPRPAGYKKLTGRNGYRIRKGDYRIIYEVHDGVLYIKIIAVGHRKDVYE